MNKQINAQQIVLTDSHGNPVGLLTKDGLSLGDSHYGRIGISLQNKVKGQFTIISPLSVTIGDTNGETRYTSIGRLKGD